MIAEFITEHTDGFRRTQSCSWQSLDWPDLEKQAGLPRASMQEFADLIRDAKNGGAGLEHGHHAARLRRRCGADDSQSWPDERLRGPRQMRADADPRPLRRARRRGDGRVRDGVSRAANRSTPRMPRQLSEQYGFRGSRLAGPDRARRWSKPRARGELDLLYCLGGNFLRTLPEPDYVASAMANVPLRVHQDIILTDQMFIEARRRSHPAAGQDALRAGRRRHRNHHRAADHLQPGNSAAGRRSAGGMEDPSRARGGRVSRSVRVAGLRNRRGDARGDRRRGPVLRWHPESEGAAATRFSTAARILCADWQVRHARWQGAFPRRAALPQCESASRGRASIVSTRRGKQFNTLIYAEIDPLTGAARDAVLMNPRRRRGIASAARRSRDAW